MLHRLPESTLCSGSGHINGSKAACRPNKQRRGLPRAPYSQRISCLHNAEGAEPTRKPAVKGLYNILEKPATVGSEHGEGFVQYAGAHESLMLDVDTLNEQLKHSGAIRLRHAMKPDEAYGMIFNFDSVVADISAVQHQAWRQLAQQHSLPFPAIPRPQVLSMSPEYNIIQTFRWTNNRKEAQALAYDLAIITSDILNTLTEPHHGVRDWLMALTNFNVPCALVSRLDRATVRRVLERMRLHDYFTTMVTSEDDMETISQRLLSAAIKLHRPPNLCVLLDASPEGVTAAHNCTMKAIAVAGQYKAYQLKMADLTCASLGGLTVYNIRRLFANRGAEFMDVKHGFSNDKPPSTRRVAAAVMD